MEIITIPNGLFDSNTYIISDNGECAVIDCGVQSKTVAEKILEKNLKVSYIILTHGHVDHVINAELIKKDTDAPLCIHEDELDLYSDNTKNALKMVGFGDKRMPAPDKLLKHGEKLSLGSSHLEIIHTPGHTPGCICILFGKALLSGDTLFVQSVGRTDLYGGNSKNLINSIKNRLFTLDEDTIVYPGHGPSTTIGFEKVNNPYV